MKLILGITAVSAILALSVFSVNAQSNSIPDWVKNTALWYGQGDIEDQEFFGMIQFLVDKELVIVPNSDTSLIEELEKELQDLKSKTVKDVQDAYNDGYSDGLNDRPRSIDTEGIVEEKENKVEEKESIVEQKQVTIEPAPGSSVPGCQETEEGCFIPSVATVDVGEVVVMSNTDTAAHTFTSGNQENGEDGVFDSGLLLTGSSFEWTPEEARVYEYFCLVHPWQKGMIIVEESRNKVEQVPVKEENKPDIIIEPGLERINETLEAESRIIIEPAPGSSVPVCQDTLEGCFIPSVATVNVGSKVIMSNTDTAAHTFTSGDPVNGGDGVFDSGLILAGSSFEWTPEEAGKYEYYCVVHPWMTDLIIVQ